MQMKDLLPWVRKDHATESKAQEDNPIATLQRDMNRVFESFWHRVESQFGGGEWGLGGAGVRSDVVETDDAIEVSVELPGMEMSDLEVNVSDDTMIVKGEKKIERKEEKKGYYLSERSYGSVYRAIPLPPGVDGDKAEARFKNGVLSVKVPKTPEAQAKVKRIEVKAS